MFFLHLKQANSCYVREGTAKTHQPLTDHPYLFVDIHLVELNCEIRETHETTTSSLFVLRLTLYVSFKCVCRKLLSVARYNISKTYSLCHVLFFSLEEFGKTKHYQGDLNRCKGADRFCRTCDDGPPMWSHLELWVRMREACLISQRRVMVQRIRQYGV